METEIRTRFSSVCSILEPQFNPRSIWAFCAETLQNLKLGTITPLCIIHVVTYFCIISIQCVVYFLTLYHHICNSCPTKHIVFLTQTHNLTIYTNSFNVSVLASKYFLPLLCFCHPVSYCIAYPFWTVLRVHQRDYRELGMAPADCWNWAELGLKEDELKGYFLGWFVGLVVLVQEIFVLPWML